jgi:hypothetical protein
MHFALFLYDRPYVIPTYSAIRDCAQNYSFVALFGDGMVS